MSEFDLREFQRKVQIGAHLRILARSGRKFEGVLVAITDDTLHLQRGDEAQFILPADWLMDWMLLDMPASPTIPRPQPPPKLRNRNTRIRRDLGLRRFDELPPWEEDGQPEPNREPSCPTPGLVQELQDRFGMSETSLQVFGPDFSAPDSLAYARRVPVIRALSDLKNRWDYAHKVHQFARLRESISSLERLEMENADLGIFAFNLGCFHFQLQQYLEAATAFMRVPRRGLYTHACHNLAVAGVHMNRPQLVWAALHQFFSSERATAHGDAWRAWMRIGADLGMIARSAAMIESQLERESGAGDPLLLESALYLLLRSGHVVKAGEFAARAGATPPPGRTPLLQEALAALLRTDAPLSDVQAAQVLRGPSSPPAPRHVQGDEVRIGQRRTTASGPHAPQSTVEKSTGPATPATRKSRGTSLVQKAFEAETRKDFEEAERLYRKAVRTRENWETAAKNLAMLLQRVKRYDDGIQLLESEMPRFTNPRPAKQILRHLYLAVGRYDAAIQSIRELIADSTGEDRVRLYRGLAGCYFMAQQYDEAEQTLKNILAEQPDDAYSQRTLEQLQIARSSGADASAELTESFRTLLNLTDFDNPRSGFLSFQLDRCDYFGVDATRVVKRDFSQRDVDDIERQIELHIKQHGRSLPREIARLNLSAARLLVDLGEKDSERINRFLLSYCAAIGDTYASEGKNFDVSRAFYAEAFLLASGWEPRLETTLNKYILSFYDSAVNVLNTRTGVHESLGRALSREPVAARLVPALLQVSVLNVYLTNYLLEKVVYDRPDLTEKVVRRCQEFLGVPEAEMVRAVDTKEELATLWNRGRNKARTDLQKVTAELRALQTGSLTFDLLEEHLARLETIRAQLPHAGLDWQRAGEVQEIVEQIIQYSRQTEYSEQENAHKIARGRAEELIKQIEDGPTRLSLELLRPYLEALREFLDEHFQQVQAAAEPEIGVTLATNEYYPNERSIVACQVNLANARGKSPASAVTITVTPSPTGEYQVEGGPVVLRESLRGGSSITAEVPVRVAEKAERAEVFTLYYTLRYSTRSGKDVALDGRLSVPLYPASSFRPFDSPYRSYAGGQPVKERHMLFGRDEYIREILALLASSPVQISHVIYGQMRSGKSSILHQLENELAYPFVPVRYSIGELLEDMKKGDALAVFMREIVRRVHRTLLRTPETRDIAALFPVPAMDDFRERPQSSLDEFFMNLGDRTDAFRDRGRPHVVLLLDEFTYLYGFILSGDLPDTFMRAWKALRERGYFSCIVVGQDYMPKFRDLYPNEFQVSEPRRVGYLAPADARKLIEEPIRLPQDDAQRPGQSRFQGAAGEAAITRLIELTDGNPFYLQGLCHRLVTYMNKPEHRAVLATDVYVEHVKRQAISVSSPDEREQRLERNYFDNLLRSGDPSPDAISEEDALAVLRVIARESRNQEDCSGERIIGVDTKAPIERILADLCLRDVLSQPKAGRYKIKVGLFKEWLIERL